MRSLLDMNSNVYELTKFTFLTKVPFVFFLILEILELVS